MIILLLSYRRYTKIWEESVQTVLHHVEGVADDAVLTPLVW